jgi:polynucleotide 5'-hydroxyl-kinase GRC3/NOL9
MKRFIHEGKTLLVDGPASIILLSGNVSVLGAHLQIEENLVVREGKRLPLLVNKNATFETMLGEGASIKEVETGSTPSIWTKAAKSLLSLTKPVTVLVLGGVDSGKTSFCTFLVNAAIKENLKTGIIDADLGQPDVGPPSTIGFNFVSKSIKDLFEIDFQEAYFFGSTSPSGAINKVIGGLTYLKARVMEAGVDFLVINTDGWINGKEMSSYKARLVQEVAPCAVVGIQKEFELTPIFDELLGDKLLIMDSPFIIQPRNRSKRKLLRELSYKKYLKDAKIRSFSLSWINIEDSVLGSGGPIYHKRLETLTNLLGKRPIYSEEAIDFLLVVLKEGEFIKDKPIRAVEDYFGKLVKVIRKGDEEGLLVGLKDEEDHFLGIGILNEVDYKRKILKIYTNVNKKVSKISFGQITLNNNFSEIGLNTVYSKTL